MLKAFVTARGDIFWKEKAVKCIFCDRLATTVIKQIPYVYKEQEEKSRIICNNRLWQLSDN